MNSGNRTLKIVAMVGLLVVGLANAQSDTPPPAFEAASVKQRIRPAGSFIRRVHFNSGAISCSEPAATELFDCGISGTRFSDSPASLLDLIIDAYNVRANAIFGLPDWGDSGHDVYDVTARVGGDKTPTLEQVRRMLQTLLADRFQLKAHRETRDLPVYDLVVSKNGTKLIKSANGCTKTEYTSPDGSVPVPSRWEQIPARLSRRADRPVIDKTGFDAEARYCLATGQYPYSAGNLLQGALIRPGAELTPGDEVANAVNELEATSGLKFVPRKEPMDILVIDYVERPSGN